MSNPCYFCHRELEAAYHVSVVGQPPERMVTQAVWVDTSLGRIGVCNICYEEERFDALTSGDVGALHYVFGHPYSEDTDDPMGSLRRLQQAFALCPYPEIEGALGYAYWKVGRTEEAVRHCRSSLAQQPNHFGASKAFYVLKREDSGVGEFARRLRAAGKRIKSVTAEFPGQRIRRPKPGGSN